MVAAVHAHARLDRKKVLVVDAEPSVRHGLKRSMSGAYEVETCDTAEAAEAKLFVFRPDVVLTDLTLPGESGLELLTSIRRLVPETIVMVVTGRPTVDVAVEAMKAGAHHFLSKPFDPQDVERTIAKEIVRQRTALAVKHQREQRLENGGTTCALGDSLEMQNVVQMATHVAGSSATVLISGESGSGKEVLARYIHEHSPRADGPFVAVNCGAIPENLLETEFFGHEQGSFTGATARRAGRFERAHGGTIFLDEIGDLPLGLQVKLLRALQERQIERVGGSEPLDVDVRVIAASNRDLDAEVQAGRFREDLFYRLDVIHLRVPPLRERAGDIATLWHRFLERVAAREGVSVPETSPAVLEELYAYDWPGNVRELENFAERAVILSRGARIEVGHLLRRAGTDGVPASSLRIPGATLAQIEKAAILRTLAAVDGSTTQCAKVLGISVRKVQYRLKQWRHETRRAAQGLTRERSTSKAF